MKWNIRELIKFAIDNQCEIKGVWVPVRPHKQCRDFFTKLGAAWHVLTGRADAVYWDWQ